VSAELDRADLRCASRSAGALRFLVTDSADRFARVGTAFLGQGIAPSHVELVDA
jgi:hypothetical protein